MKLQTGSNYGRFENLYSPQMVERTKTKKNNNLCSYNYIRPLCRYFQKKSTYYVGETQWVLQFHTSPKHFWLRPCATAYTAHWKLFVPLLQPSLYTNALCIASASYIVLYTTFSHQIMVVRKKITKIYTKENLTHTQQNVGIHSK